MDAKTQQEQRLVLLRPLCSHEHSGRTQHTSSSSSASISLSSLYLLITDLPLLQISAWLKVLGSPQTKYTY